MTPSDGPQIQRSPASGRTRSAPLTSPPSAQRESGLRNLRTRSRARLLVNLATGSRPGRTGSCANLIGRTGGRGFLFGRASQESASGQGPQTKTTCTAAKEGELPEGPGGVGSVKERAR